MQVTWNTDRTLGTGATHTHDLTDHEWHYYERTSSRSYCSFCTKNDILRAFNHDSTGEARPCLGSSDMSALHVPGLEFFASTGEDKGETEWRNEARQDHGSVR